MTFGNLSAPAGTLTIIKNRPTRGELLMKRGLLKPDEEHGHFNPARAGLLYEKKDWSEPIQKRVLAFLRDHVSAEIPRMYYNAVVGHDLHLSMCAELFVKHFHATEKDPFTGEYGWTENCGRVSAGKVTTAFRDFLALMLVTDATTIGDYKYHRPGTSATAEANTDTALITDAGLEATGNQTNPTASTYQSVATVTADATETWQEHSIRNATGAAGGTMMDRSLISPTVAVVNLDTVSFTYVLTVNAES